MKHTQILGPYPDDKEEEIKKCCETCSHCPDRFCLISSPCDIDYSEWQPKTTDKPEYIDEIDNPYHTQIGGNHYKDDYPFCQPLEFFSKNNIPFTKANVCKYVLRYDRKGGIEDLQKAMHYLRVIAWDEYGEVL